MAYGTYRGKSLRPGMGGHFARMVDALRAKGKSKAAAEGIAAEQGRRKYGAAKMASYAAAGRRRAAMKRKKG